MTQVRQIVNHMLSGKSITSFQSFRLFGCTRLPDRVRDARAKGYKIDSRWLKLPSGRRCLQYFI